MATQDEIKRELSALLKERNDIISLLADIVKTLEFGTKYQNWYTRALRIVESLAPDRLDEFISYYRIDPKRKAFSAATYVIQDYISGMSAATDYDNKPKWDANNLVGIRFYNQIQILSSLHTRIDSVLADVEGSLFAELQDGELQAAQSLMKVSLRAAGSLAGVVLERHLQRAAINHKIAIRKKSPMIADLNDPLKKAQVYDTPVWRKIQLLADIRNLCSHEKGQEPIKEQIEELIAGVNSIIKTIF